MSRHSLSEPMDGQIKLKCPYKHELGAILVRPRRSVGRQTFHRLGTVISAPKITQLPNDELQLPPDEPVDVVGIVEPGLAVVAECQRCGQTWQTPWVMIEPAIAQLEDTPVVTVTPTERSIRAQIAAHESWANTEDRSARTANARKAMLDKFERQVDPNNELSPAERAKRAEHLRKAHFKRLALKSARSQAPPARPNSASTATPATPAHTVSAPGPKGIDLNQP